MIQPLVENAIQHGFPHGQAAGDRASGSTKTDGLLVLCVSDNGVGIEPQELPKVLEPGYGRGLGIALKNIDDRLRGHFGPRSGLSIRSDVGQGTTVDLTIDLEYAETARRVTRTMPLKALVCDDEAPARSELRFLLGEVGGVEVVGEASSGAEALQLIRALPYDVVFLDIDMPGLSGMQLAEVLNGLDKRPAIIFVTAHSEYAVQAFEVAATDYLVKPVELERLRQAIERLAPAQAAGPDADRAHPGREGAARSCCCRWTTSSTSWPRTTTRTCTPTASATSRRCRCPPSSPSSSRRASTGCTAGSS